MWPFNFRNTRAAPDQPWDWNSKNWDLPSDPVPDSGYCDCRGNPWIRCPDCFHRMSGHAPRRPGTPRVPGQSNRPVHNPGVAGKLC